jgi:hypothetical protein
MTKRELARHVDRWIAIFAAREPDSPQGIVAVDEMIAIGRAAGLLPDDLVVLASCIGTHVRRTHETEMRALAAGVGVQ